MLRAAAPCVNDRQKGVAQLLGRNTTGNHSFAANLTGGAADICQSEVHAVRGEFGGFTGRADGGLAGASAPASRMEGTLLSRLCRATRRLQSATPIPGFAFPVRDSDYLEFVLEFSIDDQVGKPFHQITASAV